MKPYSPPLAYTLPEILGFSGHMAREVITDSTAFPEKLLFTDSVVATIDIFCADRPEYIEGLAQYLMWYLSESDAVATVAYGSGASSHTSTVWAPMGGALVCLSIHLRHDPDDDATPLIATVDVPCADTPNITEG